MCLSTFLWLSTTRDGVVAEPCCKVERLISECACVRSGLASLHPTMIFKNRMLTKPCKVNSDGVHIGGGRMDVDGSLLVHCYNNFQLSLLLLSLFQAVLNFLVTTDIIACPMIVFHPYYVGLIFNNRTIFMRLMWAAILWAMWVGFGWHACTSRPYCLACVLHC